MMKKILAVDDEEDILELIQYNLEKEGFEVLCAATGEEALVKAGTQYPDLILLDLMLPGLDGFQVCRTLKSDSKTQEIPIIMLTAKGEESDVVAGLEMGADDYITKPFSPNVLVARIRAILRRRKRSESDSSSILKVHDITLNPARYEVTVGDEPVHLTATEFHILQFLMKHPGWVYTRSQIIDAVRGMDYPVTDRSVDVQIVGLRKKLKESGKWIKTIRGIGYQLRE